MQTQVINIWCLICLRYLIISTLIFSIDLVTGCWDIFCFILQMLQTFLILFVSGSNYKALELYKLLGTTCHKKIVTCVPGSNLASFEFWRHTRWCSRVTPGRVQRTIWSSGDGTWVVHANTLLAIIYSSPWFIFKSSRLGMKRF